MTTWSGRNVALTGSTWPLCSASFLLRGFIAVLFLCAMLAATPTPTAPDFEGRPRFTAQEIRRAITFYAKRYRLDPALLRAVIKVESDFRPDAVSRKGAVGLMQLTPDTAVTLRVRDINDPLQNIRGGARQLRLLLTLYEDNLPLALAAYNAGIHRVKGGRIPRIRETRRYVRKVLGYYERYRLPRSCRRSAPASMSCGPGSAPHRGKFQRVDSDKKSWS